MKTSYFGQFLLFLEAAWGLLWFASIFVYQLRNDSLFFRNSFAITAFHFVNPAVIYATKRRIEAGKATLPWINFFVIGFALATDLNSLLETILHLEGPGDLWGLMMAITVFAMALSTLAFLWYTILYWRYGSGTSKALGAPGVRFTWGRQNPSP